jgi:hypothetical protein
VRRACAEREFEQTLESYRRRREHVGTCADLATAAAEIAEQVRFLDGLVRYRFLENAELMGAWASARKVLGPFKAKGGSEVPPGQVAPAA